MSSTRITGQVRRPRSLRTPHGECDCPECVDVRAEIRRLRAALHARTPAIPSSLFEALAVEQGFVEPRDRSLRAKSRALVVERWVELAQARAEAAEAELDAALVRAIEAREELERRCDVAEVTLAALAREVDASPSTTMLVDFTIPPEPA